MGRSQTLQHAFSTALLALDRAATRRIVEEAVAVSGPIGAADELIAPVLERLGAGWEEGTVALAQIYMGARLCEELLETILPAAHQGRRTRPKMAIAVLEDHHQLGKRIVHSALRAAGYELLDYGRITVDQVVERALGDGIEILLLSTLMLPSALRVRAVCERLSGEPVRPAVVVGGAPFLLDPRLWIEVGADAMGRNASEAIPLVARLGTQRAST